MLRQNVWWILWFIGFVGFLGYVPGLPDELRLLNLCFALHFIRSLVKRRVAVGQQPEKLSRQNEPLPPSAGSPTLMGMRYLTATVLSLVIPRMLAQMIRQIIGQTQAEARGFIEPTNYQQKVRYRLPFNGTWYVFNGGVTSETSHSWDIVAQRFAYDFVVTDDALRRWRTDGKDVEDYLCYGLPILAPAEGEIVSVVDNVRDAPGTGTGWLDLFTQHFPGNAVTIRHAEREYSFLAHLIPGSIRVCVGDLVEQGQVIAFCGNSGYSTEPHLHFHVQDHADFFQAAGLPIAFDNVCVNGEVVQDHIYLIKGMHVCHSEMHRRE